MTWASAFIAALKRRLPFALRASGSSCQPTSASVCGIAPPMPVMPKRDEMPNLERRALMYYNRDQKKASAYLAKHRALTMMAKERCSDA